MLPILFAGITHLLIGDMRYFDQSRSPLNGNYYPYRTVHIFEFAWWSGATRYLFGLVTHALLYMSLAKWIAAFFSLQLNSQMKAMIGTIVSILALCIVPPMLTALPLIFAGTNPEREGFQSWFLTTPAFVFAFNEVHDFNAMTRNGWWLRSEYFTLLANLFIYGTLMLIVRAFVLWRLPVMLNRADNDWSGTQIERSC